MRIVIASVIVLIGMIAMMAGIGILNLASLLEESGLPRRYQSTQSANIHDSYFTIDLFGFIPIAGIPDVRIGLLLIGVSILIYCGVAAWLFKSHVLKSKSD